MSVAPSFAAYIAVRTLVVVLALPSVLARAVYGQGYAPSEVVEKMSVGEGLVAKLFACWKALAWKTPNRWRTI